MTDPLEHFARVTPPRTHVRQVLERSGPGAGRRRAVPLLRWLVPAAACLVVMAGALVTIGTTRFDAPLVVPPTSGDWSGKGVDVPVLPPRAYWEMSAIEEFERLRPAQTSPRVPASGQPASRTAAHQAAFPRPDALAHVDAWADVTATSAEIGPIDITAIEIGTVDVVPMETLPPILVEEIGVSSLTVVPLSEEAQ